eukprot:TRINITY_DN23998_c0_g1_i1.p1 TRINITY_DN23998_c0_g1~~TRINITY_DN23998_c0_g1_i1.p1  ORF type:complete len:418 (+),score=48.80 TRINITY_DN23998_c0_g1_i1:61-1314(+)
MASAEGHSAAWGSFYCTFSHRWGYACCLLCERDAECVPAKLALEDPAHLEMPVSGEAETNANSTRSQDRAASGTSSSKTESEPAAKRAPAATAQAPRQAPARVAAARAEAERILSLPKSTPLKILGLLGGADAYAVRSAFRRIALLIHPDKNPGCEEECKQALVRAQEAREAIERGECESSSAQGNSEAARTADGKRNHGKTSAPAARPDSGPVPEPGPRDSFDSAEAYVAHVLQYLMEEWQRYVVLAVGQGGSNPESATRGANVRAHAAAIAGGPDGVLRSGVALKQTATSVKALRKLLKVGSLGGDALDKIEKMCCEIMSREYTAANQAYMHLAIGNKAWHLEVPTLLEGGMAGATGKERGNFFKQARMASKLNASSASTCMDDAEVRQHVVALKRLLTVAQVIRPNSDVSKNTC